MRGHIPVVLGAILIVEQESGDFVGGPLGCVEVLGRSVLERTIERFVEADVRKISILVQAGTFDLARAFRNSFANVIVAVTDDVWAAVAQILHQYSQTGIDHAFISKANAYTEVDFVDLVQFHREGRRTVTRASDDEGFLDLWVASCGAASPAMFAMEFRPAAYPVREYVNRLGRPRDLRRLVADVFRRRCQMSPVGREIKPGVWADEGVQIHRRARIVAPAYVGWGSVIREDTLITRFSNIEGFSYIDYGTVIEDSSILANTYVGIWLDVCHAVVQGSRFLNLERDVALEISDPSLIRANVAVQDEANRQSAAIGYT